MALTQEDFIDAGSELIDIDVLVIGAGLFGSVIGEALQNTGRVVSYIDSQRPDAGSIPAACLMKPSWLSGMGKDNYNPALTLLDELFGIVDVDFYTAPFNKHVTVHWVPPVRIMKWRQAIKGTVTEIGQDGDRSIVHAYIDKKLHRIRANLLIVAAGIWTKKLIPVPDLKGQAGAAFAWPGSSAKNTIRVWAPYKQVVTLNNWHKGWLWVGDGSAIKPINWTAERQDQSLERCAQAVNRRPSEARTYYGVRPYIKGVKTCHLEKLEGNIWVATGGAKNGTAAAGWAAQEILKVEV